MGSRTVLRQVVQPVGDIPSALEFYASLLGLEVRFVDEGRYAALDAGGTTLALAGPEEDVALVSAPAFTVSDLDDFLGRLAAAGGSLVKGPEAGPHERSAVVGDPWGNRIIVSQPR